MLKTFTWSCTYFALLISFMAAGTSPVGGQPGGIGITGDIGIFQESDLAIDGDVFLLNAQVRGTGNLMITGNAPHALIANNSTIENLKIDNPSKVTLIGNLAITNSLEVHRGIFDTQAAILTLSDTCEVNLYLGGKILFPKIELAQSPILPLSLVSTNLLFQNLYLGKPSDWAKPKVQWVLSSGLFLQKDSLTSRPFLTAIDPPPRNA